MLPFTKMPAFFLGLVFTGWAAALIYAALGVAQIYAGWGLLRLNERGRQVAIAIYVLSAVQTLLMLLVPGVRERVQEATEMFTPVTETSLAPDPTGIWWGWMGVALLAIVVMLWLLVKWKGVFRSRFLSVRA